MSAVVSPEGNAMRCEKPCRNGSGSGDCRIAVSGACLRSACGMSSLWSPPNGVCLSGVGSSSRSVLDAGRPEKGAAASRHVRATVTRSQAGSGTTSVPGAGWTALLRGLRVSDPCAWRFWRASSDPIRRGRETRRRSWTNLTSKHPMRPSLTSDAPADGQQRGQDSCGSRRRPTSHGLA